MLQDGRAYLSRRVRAPDGLSLHLREYGRAPDRALPVVCLPGLARNSEDFDALARLLAGDPEHPRRVLALDYRGRGLSDRDPDPSHYDVRVEANDVLAVLGACGVAEAAFVGTSRGGLITMAIAAMRPAVLRAAVLVDIGPVIEAKGLLRIRGYVGKLPTPKGWPEAVEVLKRLSSAQFPGFDDADWERLARGTWREENGKLVTAYDPALSKTLEALDLEQSPPPLWPLYEALSHVPVLGIRGRLTDLLSPETFAEMGRRHPRFTAHEVEGEGHAPLLRGATAQRIADFIAEAEADALRAPPEPSAADAEAPHPPSPSP